MQICFSSCWPTNTTNLDVQTVAVQTISVFWLPLVVPVLPALLFVLCADDGMCGLVADTLLLAETSAGWLWSVSWNEKKRIHTQIHFQFCFYTIHPASLRMKQNFAILMSTGQLTSCKHSLCLPKCLKNWVRFSPFVSTENWHEWQQSFFLKRNRNFSIENFFLIPWNRQ